MTDIVKQLRGPVLPDDLFVGQWPGEEVKTYDAVRFHAADEIERLRAALQSIASTTVSSWVGDIHEDAQTEWRDRLEDAISIARAALEGPQDRMAKPLGGENDR